MPLFQRQDPDIGSLVAYLVARSLERGVTLNQTKLVKLLYLIDVERAASGRESLTQLRWIFYHYGPYALELPDKLAPLEGDTLIVVGYKDSRLYRAAPEAPDGEDWPPATRRQVDEVVRRFAALDLNRLLDHVYFQTAPMRTAVRGEPLNMSLARTEPEPRTAPPLPSPTLPPDAPEHLAAWRERRRAQSRAADSGADRMFLVDEEQHETPPEGTRGRLVITAETEAQPPS